MFDTSFIRKWTWVLAAQLPHPLVLHLGSHHGRLQLLDLPLQLADVRGVVVSLLHKGAFQLHPKVNSTKRDNSVQLSEDENLFVRLTDSSLLFSLKARVSNSFCHSSPTWLRNPDEYFLYQSSWTTKQCYILIFATLPWNPAVLYFPCRCLSNHQTSLYLFIATFLCSARSLCAAASSQTFLSTPLLSAWVFMWDFGSLVLDYPSQLVVVLDQKYWRANAATSKVKQW